MPDPIQDTRYVCQQYTRPDNLDVRIRTHQLYGEAEVDFPRWVLDHISWRGDERVLDVGCGNGGYVQPVRERTPHYIAADLSLGMLRSLSPGSLSRINLDVQALPLASSVADVVLANHMLYHVPEQDAAVAGFARVLRPSGRLLAATNSLHSMSELRQLSLQALEQLAPGASDRYTTPASSFSLEDGAALLGRHFAHVQRHDLSGALIFPEPQPVIDYLASMKEIYASLLPAGLAWEDVAARVRHILSQHTAEHGVFRVNKLTGVFVCWND